MLLILVLTVTVGVIILIFSILSLCISLCVLGRMSRLKISIPRVSGHVSEPVSGTWHVSVFPLFFGTVRTWGTGG